MLETNNMIAICISKEVTGGGLTFGKKYDVIKRGRNPNCTHAYVDSFLLKNDLGVEMWYDKSPYIIEVLTITGESIKYIGEKCSGLTIGKCYEVIDKERDYEYHYFIDDNNKFVGIRKRNYLGGAANFIEVTKVRNEKIENILK
jgi:hypothetical protein